MKNFFPQHKKRTYPHISRGRFYNYPDEELSHVLLPSVYMYVRSLLERVFHPSYDPQDWIIRQHPQQQSSQPVVTWIGHATFLLQIGGLNILTDPLFGRPSFLYSRLLPPGLALNHVPPIDVVVISHNHPDHMSSRCLSELEKKFKPQILVPQNVGAWFHARKFTHIEECMWWQKVSIPAKDDPEASVEISFLPARHWSQRSLFDCNKTLWGSWMVSYKGHHIYFAGDTAYGGHFAEIGQEFNNIHTALLPIGPCEPHTWLHHTHTNANQALQAFIDLDAQEFIPMHWGTFHFGTDHFYMPVEQLLKGWHQQKELLVTKVLRVAKVGEQLLSTLPVITQIQPQPTVGVQGQNIML